MVKWILLAILLLPALEIGVFVLVALGIGFAQAVGVSLFTSLAGVVILRLAGRGRITRLRQAVSDQDAEGFRANAGGLVTVLAGLLLVLPGFITDTLGALLLVPPVRSGLTALARRMMPAETKRRGGEVVDLTPDEWERVRPREIDRAEPPPDPAHPSRRPPG